MLKRKVLVRLLRASLRSFISTRFSYITPPEDGKVSHFLLCLRLLIAEDCFDCLEYLVLIGDIDRASSLHSTCGSGRGSVVNLAESLERTLSMLRLKWRVSPLAVKKLNSFSSILAMTSSSASDRKRLVPMRWSEMVL
jgi:hypothetical protein